MKKLIALILAIVMILSLSICASALEMEEYIYLRIDLEGVEEVTTCVMSFEGMEGGLHLNKMSNGLYYNVYYAEDQTSAFVLTVDYYDENDELIRIETEPMYLSDVEGILVLDEEGLHVENSYLFQSVGDRNTKTIPVSGTFAGEEEETEVYCVDMEWGSLEFVFTPYVEWNPETHTYDPVEDTPGTWDLAENANNHVRITNHSNVGIDIGLTFKGHEEFGVKGAFFTDTDGNGDVITGFTVPSAVGTEVEAAPYDVAFLRITDGTIPEDLSGPASFVDEAGNAMIGEILVAITAIETEQ